MTPAWVLIVFNGLVALVWLTRHLQISRERRVGTVLTPTSPADLPDEPPAMTIIVAAKDEQDNIRGCLESLLAQDYPNLEVICANDRSTDDTSRIAHELADKDSRLRVIDIDHLPESWTGKCHAVHSAIGQARGEWLLLTDADCRFLCPATARVAMRHALDHNADLLSALPELEIGSVWESVIQPICSGVMMVWHHPDKVNNTASVRAYANGAFMLFRRDAWQAVGGHEGVKRALNEDIELAVKVKQHPELTLRVARTAGLFSVRMYTSLRQILAGWARIFLGTFRSLGKTLASLALVVVMGIGPWVCAAWACIALAGGARPGWLWGLAGAVSLTACLLQLTVIGRFRKLANAGLAWTWTYPLGSIVVSWILIRAAMKVRPGAKVVWKGTVYESGK